MTQRPTLRGQPDSMPPHLVDVLLASPTALAASGRTKLPVGWPDMHAPPCVRIHRRSGSASMHFCTGSHERHHIIRSNERGSNAIALVGGLQYSRAYYPLNSTARHKPDLTGIHDPVRLWVKLRPPESWASATNIQIAQEAD